MSKTGGIGKLNQNFTHKNRVTTGKKTLVAGLDIGTTKVTCVIGQIGADGMEVVGVGNAPNSGMRQGVVVNIEATTEAICKAKEEAELMSGTQVKSVWLGIGGSHVQSFSSQGMVAVRNKEVAAEDIDRVIEAAKAVAIPNDRQVLHVLPKEFRVDGQEGICDPVGMSGVRLEAAVHIITGSHSAIQNSMKCTHKAGLQVNGLVLQQLASSLAVLSEDERSLGVCVVDMGGGTCDLITLIQGAVAHTSVIPVGGQNFTHDIAMGLRTTQQNGEVIKRKFGCAIPDMVNLEETLEVESVGGRKSRTLARKDLCDVIEARAEETLNLLKEELEKQGLLSRLGSGIVLTGGASLLAGLVEMGDFIFDIPVRRGVPDRIGGLTDVVRSANYSTAVGLLLYGMKHKEKEKPGVIEVEEALSQKLSGWTQRLKDLFG